MTEGFRHGISTESVWPADVVHDERTFPDSRPEDITILTVHHQPLTVEMILPHRAYDAAWTHQPRWNTCWTDTNSHVSSWILTRDIASTSNGVRCR